MEGKEKVKQLDRYTIQPYEIATARNHLREMFPPGSTIHTILRHVSQSGMTRAISVVHDNSDISYLVARAYPKWRINQRHGGITMTGCGMDMGFSLAYTLSRTLYPEGFECIGTGDPDVWGSRCPSNDHSNGDREYSPHHHDSGGYALRHSWI